METLVRPAVASHARLCLPTRRPTEFIDITDRITVAVRSAAPARGDRQRPDPHTTAAIVVNEHEPLLLEDFAGVLEATAPTGRAYRHDDLRVRRVNLTPGERSTATPTAGRWCSRPRPA